MSDLTLTDLIRESDVLIDTLVFIAGNVPA
jgi:hypothetical protein